MGEFDLRDFGYAAGQYLHKHCKVCNEEFMGDKRADVCCECVKRAWKNSEPDSIIDIHISTGDCTYSVKVTQGSHIMTRTGDTRSAGLVKERLGNYVLEVVESALVYLASERSKQLELVLAAEQKSG